MAKKTLALILCILMILPMAVACAETGTGVTTTEPAQDATTVGGTEPEETELKSSVLPDDLDFKQETVMILSRNSDFIADEICVDDINGSIVNDNVFRRDQKVQKLLGVIFESRKLTGDQYVVSTELRNAAQTGEHRFDISANSTYSTIMYTGESILCDLKECEYLDLDAVYWSQGFNDSASIGDRQFLATGAISMSLFRYMFVTFYNKRVLEESGYKSMYEIVDEGKWTLDYQIQIAKELYKDNDGSGTVTEGDRVGFLGATVLYVDPYWSSCDITIVKKDSDNLLEYDLDTAKLSSVVDKLIVLYHDSNAWIDNSSGDDGKQTAMGNLFSNGLVGTTTMRLCSVETEQFTSMQDKYGVIPVPKYDELQEKHYTFLHDQFTSYGIASYHANDDKMLQMCGAVLEALALESYKLVVPAYYELALKGRYLDDPDSWRMLDMIYENVKLDPGVLYTKSLSSIHQIPRDMVRDGTNYVTSKAGTLKKLITKTQLPKLLDSLLSAK